MLFSKQIVQFRTFFLSLFFRTNRIRTKQQRSSHAQVRWRQQTLPAVYFEDHVGHQSLTEYPTSPLATTATATTTTTGAREKSQLQSNVKWSYSIQSSHGTSVHSSFDTLEGTNTSIIRCSIFVKPPEISFRWKRLNLQTIGSTSRFYPFF